VKKIRLLNAAEPPMQPCCIACGINICWPELCLDCWTDCACEWYVPPCTDCSPVE
jgi:hypothetical protein